jgi:hypothetical protein
MNVPAEKMLDELPEEHPLRNMPLADLEAQYQLLTAGPGWRTVKPNFGIANNTFNELGPVWRLNHKWRVKL